MRSQMRVAEYRWDTKTELRTRCELSLRLSDGHQFFTAGKNPLATATLKPDGKILDITICMDRVLALMPNVGSERVGKRKKKEILSE